MVVGKVVRLALVLLVKLPAELLVFLAFNLARILAPGLLVKTIKGKMGEKGMPGKCWKRQVAPALYVTG